jgi:murein DD-endopeptidase MepM/ murein hydrolase activator NlpD
MLWSGTCATSQHKPSATIPEFIMSSLKYLFFVIIVLALAFGGYLVMRDMTPPEFSVTPSDGPVSAHKSLQVKVSDDGAGLRNLVITATQNGQSVPLLSRDYPAGTGSAEETVTLVGGNLKDGPVELHLQAADRAYLGIGHGNQGEQVLAYTIDNKPPQVGVLSVQHNINQGGSALVAYTVSEEVQLTGVRVGDRLFPGHMQPSGVYLCLFAFPWDMDPATFVPKVVAVDAAGNERAAGFYFHLTPKSFPTDRINISDQFLNNKIVPDFQHFFPETTDPLQLFLKVNGDLRKQNTATIIDYGRQTAAEKLWDGVFVAQPNAAVPGAFAQRRTYYHNDQVIDHQTHLGIDLASLAHAEVPASNTGRVIHADDLGIYGQCVIIDHGLGLQTLYGHLSQILVNVGDDVVKGQPIGRTGSSGLAGGDHLHFSVMVAGEQVNPLEWLDAHWIKDNILSKLELVGNPQ